MIEAVQEQQTGGFVEVSDGTVTEYLKAFFNQAFAGVTGVIYTLVKLVVTQVVAGTNYKFLADGTKTTNPITKGTYYITVSKDLNGNVSLMGVEVIEEKQEEIKKEAEKTVDYLC